MDKESVNRQPVPDSEKDDSLKISNLSIGMVVKNYKILCHLLNQEAKTGKAKQYQLKNFERYFAWKKQDRNLLLWIYMILHWRR